MNTYSHAALHPPAIAVVYSRGGIIDITLTLTANHGGRHSFRVCPSTSPSVGCLGSNFLTAVSGDNIASGKRYWYLPFNAARWLTNEVYRSQWRLPAGISCENGCILQWQWAAYQNCALPCESSSIDDTRFVSVPRHPMHTHIHTKFVHE